MKPLDELVRENCSKLFRETTRTPKNVVLIGNGAVKDGWGPIERLIGDQKSFPFLLPAAQIRRIGRSRPNLGHILAKVSLAFRAKRAEAFNAVYNNRSTLNDIPEKYPLLDRFIRFRDQLAAEFVDPKLGLRNVPKEIESLLSLPDTAVITTNWDRALWNWSEKGIKNLCQLHGIADSPGSLILPTDFMHDESPFHTLFEESMSGKANSRNQTLRENLKHFALSYCKGMSYIRLSEAHQIAQDWLNSAENIYSWGMAFNVYDAELNYLVFNAGADRTRGVRRLVNFNPDPRTTSTLAALLRFQFDPDRSEIVQLGEPNSTGKLSLGDSE